MSTRFSLLPSFPQFPRVTTAVRLSLLAALALTYLALAQPPLATAAVSCAPSTPANEIEPPPPPWQLAHQPRPANLAQPLGPDGYVPKPAPGAVPANVAALPAPVVPATKGMAAESLRSTGPTPPRPASNPPFYYAGEGWQATAVGESAEIQVGAPTLPALPGSHSLAQIALARADRLYSVEIGWHVDPNFGPGTRLFIYTNKDGYASHGQPGGSNYNSYLVPAAGATHTLNELGPLGCCHQYGVMYQSGNWWFFVDNNWIGYVPGSFWGGNYTAGNWVTVYGEVYDRSRPNTMMGNGLRGTQTGSLVMGNPIMYPNVNTAQLVVGHPNDADNPYPVSAPDYNLGSYYAYNRSWHWGGN